MISLAYYRTFIKYHCRDDRFIDMARFLGMENADKPEDFLTALENLQKACGVADLKMSDYGIKEEEFEGFVKNARTVMRALFPADPYVLSDEDCVNIYKESYK